jgi:TetR/AcrR family transcriptional repressor of nem operon
MSNVTKPADRPRGRPREFDMEAALDVAMLLFRERGYHDTSLTDLGSAMRLAPGSIYKAFNNKRQIFLAVFNRYTQGRHEALERALQSHETGRTKLEAALLFLAETSHGTEGKTGCLVVGSTTDVTTFDPEVASEVAHAVLRMERRFRDLIKVGHADGSLAKSLDPDVTANTLLCFSQGLRVVGKIGRTRAEMTASIAQVMSFL